ncbi:vacuolar iron transporter homolog 4-like [Euphorbia lathyris]|uniref:vacuolar iron transporter homolog 4-like n=1 Tax=Euphorbia lathyris TaxID=212925 RepID=UPI00331432E8
MAPNQESTQIQTPLLSTDHENQSNPDHQIQDYSKRAQWLRAAILGANDGLLSTTSLMVGVGAVYNDPKTIILAGIAGLVAGACSMAIGEFVSVYSQYDTEMAQLKREMRSRDMQLTEIEAKKKEMPSPLKAAGASAFAFAVGAVIPLIGACFVKNYGVMVGVVIGLASLALLGFGWFGAILGRTPVVKSCFRVLVGGWMAMGITYVLAKTIGSTAF